MSTIETNKIRPSSGTNLTIGDSGDTVTLTSGAKTSGFGKIGQVVSATKTNTQSISNNSLTDITDLSLNITPSSTSSKILIFVSIHYGNSAGSINNFFLKRDTTDIGIGDADGSRSRTFMTHYGGATSTAINLNVSNNFLDEPSTSSQITYKLQLKHENGTAYINRNHRNNNSSVEGRPTSTITAMEILD